MLAFPRLSITGSRLRLPRRDHHKYDRTTSAIPRLSSITGTGEELGTHGEAKKKGERELPPVVEGRGLWLVRRRLDKVERLWISQSATGWLLHHSQSPARQLRPSQLDHIVAMIVSDILSTETSLCEKTLLALRNGQC